jgi:hypothetical protein
VGCGEGDKQAAAHRGSYSTQGAGQEAGRDSKQGVLVWEMGGFRGYTARVRQMGGG